VSSGIFQIKKVETVQACIIHDVCRYRIDQFTNQTYLRPSWTDPIFEHFKKLDLTELRREDIVRERIFRLKPISSLKC